MAFIIDTLSFNFRGSAEIATRALASGSVRICLLSVSRRALSAVTVVVWWYSYIKIHILFIFCHDIARKAQVIINHIKSKSNLPTGSSWDCACSLTGWMTWTLNGNQPTRILVELAVTSQNVCCQKGFLHSQVVEMTLNTFPSFSFACFTDAKGEVKSKVQLCKKRHYDKGYSSIQSSHSTLLINVFMLLTTNY